MSSPSLRTRVALAAALAALVVVVVLGAVAAVVVQRSTLTSLDRREQAVAAALAPAVEAGRAPGAVRTRGYVVTVRRDGQVVSSSGPELPDAGDEPSTVVLGGEDYRVVTLGLAGGVRLGVGAPVAETAAQVSTLQRRVALAGLAAVLVAGGLGWLFAGRALRPLTRVTEAVRALGPDSAGAVVSVRGAREAEELAAEVTELQARVDAARARTAEALATARDFAAAAAHELRTPLTAVRTDLQVLGMAGLGEAERAEVLTDLLRTQDRVEATLTALGRLAAGELGGGTAADVDLAELLDRVAADARRTHPGVEVAVRPGEAVVVRGHAAGLRLALDNLVTNAVRHGGAGHVLLGAAREGPQVWLVVDDDGAGVPAAEREAVFGRFVRGAGSRGTGSGLGLALVAQQAALHGGRAELGDSPLGGTRARLLLLDPPRT
ncbi:HAMP domain-containing sensor histidine kinase [Rhodococcus aerolatus]